MRLPTIWRSPHRGAVSDVAVVPMKSRWTGRRKILRNRCHVRFYWLPCRQCDSVADGGKVIVSDAGRFNFYIVKIPIDPTVARQYPHLYVGKMRSAERFKSARLVLPAWPSNASAGLDFRQ